MDEVLDLARALESDFRGRDDLLEQLRRLRFLANEPKLPPTVAGLLKDVLRTPLAYEQVRRVVGVLTVHPPQFEVVPNGESERAQASADAVERWLNTAWARLEEVSGLPVFQKLVDHVVADGIGVLQVCWEPWAHLPEPQEGEDPADYSARFDAALKEAPFPFRLEVIDPMCFYPLVDAGNVMAAVVLWGKRRVYRLADGRTWYGPLQNRRLRRRGGETVEWLEYWSPSERRVYINQQLQVTEANPLGFVPFVQALGEVTTAGDPERQALSFLFPMLYLIPALDTALNIKAIWGLVRAFPPMVARQMPMPTTGGQSNQAHAQVLALGQIYEGGPMGQIEPIQFPDVGKDLDQTIQLLLGLIDRAGLSPVMAGISPGARTPGYALSELRQAALSRLQGPVYNISRALSQACRMMLRIVQEQVRAPVYVPAPQGEHQPRRRSWLKLSPSDIGYVADIIARIVWTLPSDDIAAGQHALGMWRGGMWSWETAAKRSGVEDTVSERMRILKEKLLDQLVFNTPEFAQAVLNRIMAEAGHDVPEPAAPPAGPTTPEGMAAEAIQAMQGGGLEGAAAEGELPSWLQAILPPTMQPGPGPGNVVRRGAAPRPGVGMELQMARPGASPETQALPRFAFTRGRAAGAARRPGGRKRPAPEATRGAYPP